MLIGFIGSTFVVLVQSSSSTLLVAPDASNKYVDSTIDLNSRIVRRDARVPNALLLLPSSRRETTKKEDGCEAFGTSNAILVVMAM